LQLPDAGLPDTGLGEGTKPHPFGYRVAQEEASADVAAFGLRLCCRVTRGLMSDRTSKSPRLYRLAGIRPGGRKSTFGANPHFKLARFGYNRHNKQ
jgi:hypothetical protein